MALSETAYCTDTQINGRIGYTLSASSEPTLTQASDFANTVYNDINGRLLGKGVSAPVDATASPISYEILAGINCILAAAACLFSLGAPDDNELYPEAVRLYNLGEAMLKNVLEFPQLLSDAGRTTQGPTSYQSEYSDGRGEEDESDLGSDIVRPFEIGQDW